MQFNRISPEKEYAMRMYSLIKDEDMFVYDDEL